METEKAVERLTWQDLYHAFEMSADRGFLTQFRSKGQVAYGSWPCWSMRYITS